MIASMIKRLLLAAYTHGWLSFATVDAAFERWPWLRSA
jgi:hypothetical protein